MPIIDEQRIEPPGRESNAGSGRCLHQEGDRLAVVTSAWVLIYERNGDLWTVSEELVPSADFRSSQCSIAFSADKLVVGVPRRQNRRGAIYIWENDGSEWTETAFIEGGSQLIDFGQDVAIEAGRVLVGAPDAGDGDDGEVTVFEKSGEVWIAVQVLASPDSQSNRFGESISLDGSTLFVGDPQFLGPIDGDGAVYLFEDSGSGYEFVQRLQPTDEEGAEVGEVVLVEDDRLFIASRERLFYYEDDGGWTLRQELSFDVSPVYLNLDGQTLFVSEFAATSVQLFSGGQWQEESRFDGGRSLVLGPGLAAAVDFPVRLFRREGAEWVDRGLFPGSIPPLANSRFGQGVAVEGDLMAIAMGYVGPGLPAAVETYRRLGLSWQRTGELEEIIDFGGIAALAMDGGRILVGSPFFSNAAGNSVGRADLFEPDGSGGWTQIELASGSFFDSTGTSVALAGNLALVGKPGDDGPFNSGSALVFERQSGSGEWLLVQTLEASDAISDAFFGQKVAIAGETLIVGAPARDEPFTDVGAVYIFERSVAPEGEGPVDPFTETQKLVPSDFAESDIFGSALATSGDLLAIGANGITETYSGSAYIFERSGPGQPYAEGPRLFGLDSVGGDRLGRSVSFSGDGSRLAVGASRHAAAGDRTGAIYIFEESGGSWSQVDKITASDAQMNDELGEELAASGDVLVTGLPLSDRFAINSGLAFVYSFLPPGTDSVEVGVTLEDDADPAASGSALAYTATVTNGGAVAAPETALTFDLGPSLSAISTSGCAEDPAGYPFCTLGTVGAGAGAQVQLLVQTDPIVEAEVELTASVISGLPDSTPLDDSATETTTLESQTDLQVTLAATTDPLRPGQAASYEVTVTAAGPSVARETDLDVQFSGDADIVNSTGCPEGAAMTGPCPLGWVEPGAPKSILFDAIVAPGATVALEFSADGSSSTVEISPGDESVSASTVINTAPWSTFVEVLRQGVGGVGGLTDPDKVEVSGDGRWVYVVGASGVIAVFERQIPGCGLSFVGASASGSVDVVSNSAGDRVVTAASATSLAYYGIDNSGSLTLLDLIENGVDGVSGLDGITDLEVSGDTLAVSAGGSGALLTFELADDGVSLAPTATTSGPSDFVGSEAVAIDGDRVYIAQGPVGETSTVNAFRIDPVDDSLDFEAFLGFFGWARSLEADGGELFAANAAESRLFAFNFDDTTFGSVTGLGTRGMTDLALDPAGELIYTAAPDDDALGLFVRNDVQALPSPSEVRLDGVDGVDGLAGANAVAVAPTADCVYVVSDVEDALAVFQIDFFVPEIFSDGFESGETSAWSTTMP